MGDIEFLNIDLDIESTSDIAPLVAEWADRVVVLRQERLNDIYYGSFETTKSDINPIVDEYIDLISNLAPASQTIWNQAIKRELDFGFNSGASPNNFHAYLSADLVAKIATAGCSIALTIYPVADE